MDKTKIQVSRQTWRELNLLKQPGESFDDVLSRILKKELESIGIYRETFILTKEGRQYIDHNEKQEENRRVE